jgi:hypothetical protein
MSANRDRAPPLARRAVPAGALAGGFVAHVGGLRAPYVIGGIVSGSTIVAVRPALLRARPDT